MRARNRGWCWHLLANAAFARLARVLCRWTILGVRLPTIRPFPLAILVVTVVAEVAAVVLSWGLEPAYDTLLYVVFSVGMAGAGALILTRHRRHAVGWLLVGIGVVNALTADLAQGWGA